MKVKVGKSIKFGQEFHYYEIESDDVPLANLQTTKDWLDKIVTGWLNQANPKPSNGNGNGNGKTCYVCGKPINPKYKQCYECWQRHKT